MSLIVGVDSYITVAEAKQIAADNFPSTHPAFKTWNDTSDTELEKLLRASCRAINNLKFDGRRRNAGQTLEFPRDKTSMCGVGYRLYVGQLNDNGLVGSGDSDGGLGKAKLAQVINAVWAAHLNNAAADLAVNNIKGLTAKKVGPISESYTASQSNTYNRDAMIGIYTKEVYSILTPWVCASRLGM